MKKLPLLLKKKVATPAAKPADKPAAKPKEAASEEEGAQDMDTEKTEATDVKKRTFKNLLTVE